MQDRHDRCSRRKFLAQAAALTLASGMPEEGTAAGHALAPQYLTRPPHLSNEKRKPLAVVCTVYRPLAHAYHIVGRFLHGYSRGGDFHVPSYYVRTMYVDQRPDNDLSRSLSREFDFRLSRSIEDLLIEDGQLAVEGVLLIGEHGNYPRNDKGQILYPRYEFLEQTVSAFRKTGQVVPVFNSLHLSYSWSRAKKMIGWAEELSFPLLAGSSLPATWRRPEFELPLDSPIKDALVAGYGPMETYGFHALEALQCMVERRQGGEVGVQSVTCLTGKEVWQAGDAGRWDWGLLEAALERSESINPGDIRRNVGCMAVQPMPATPAIAFLIEYRDGTRGTVLLLNGHMQDFCFAGRLQGEARPASCLFHLPPPPGAKHFDCQVAQVEEFFSTGQSPSPVERTLLTSGILAAAMESHYRRGSRIETPELELGYAAAADSGFCRTSVAKPL